MVWIVVVPLFHHISFWIVHPLLVQTIQRNPFQKERVLRNFASAGRQKVFAEELPLLLESHTTFPSPSAKNKKGTFPEVESPVATVHASKVLTKKTISIACLLFAQSVVAESAIAISVTLWKMSEDYC